MYSASKPTAFRTRKASGRTWLPMPSPGMVTTVCFAIRAVSPLVILSVRDFFDVVKNRGCKQNSYDDKLVINSKKSQTLSEAPAESKDPYPVTAPPGA